MTDKQNKPMFEGLVLQQDPDWNYYFWYPKGWHTYDLSDERSGILCSPEAQDPATFFSVEARKLEVAVQAGDLDILREGIEQGLAQLPGLVIESAQESGGARITFERVYTFQDGTATRKRRIRLLYTQNRYYSLISQGKTPKDYEYWLSMLNYCYSTFQLGLFQSKEFA